MDNTYRKRINKEYPSFFYIILPMLLKIVLFNLINIENFRVINCNYSEIHIIIIGNGTQNILGKDFQFVPSKVIVNGNTSNTCNKTCDFTEEFNNITLKFPNHINSTQNMFIDLHNILKIDLFNFDVSQVTSMEGMFQYCSNLTSVIFPISNTHKLIDISYMFFNCTNLETINLGNINISSVLYMNDLFYNCRKLSSIILSNLDISNVTTFGHMFDDCDNLKYLELMKIFIKK